MIINDENAHSGHLYSSVVVYNIQQGILTFWFARLSLPRPTNCKICAIQKFVHIYAYVGKSN